MIRFAPAAWPLSFLLFLAACAGEMTAPGPSAPADGTSQADPHPDTFELPGEGEPEIPDIAAEELLGLQGEELAALLGEPMQRRSEVPAEIWQYRTDTCVVDVVFYEVDASARVDYVEARDRTAEPADSTACLEDVLREKALGAGLPMG